MVAVLFGGSAAAKAKIALSGTQTQLSATSTQPTSAAAKAAAIKAKAAKAKAAKLKAAKLKAAKLKAAKLKAAKLKAARLKAAQVQANALAVEQANWRAKHGASSTPPATPAPVDPTPATGSPVPSASPIGFPITVPSTTPVATDPPVTPTATPTVAPSTTSAPSPTVAPTTSAPSPTATPSIEPLSPAGQPGPSNTGVPAGTVLTVFNGDLTLDTAGATYSNLDVHGYVRVNAPNVTIKNSIIRGGSNAPGNGIVNDTSLTATNFLIEDSELVPEFPTVGLDCIKGFNYTALRVNMHGTVDGAKFYGPNATVKDSWIHGLVTYAVDPAQNGGQSHNDGVQVLSGSNMWIIGNTIEGGSNTGIQVTQDHGIVTSLTINGNWMSGGACTINLANKPLPTLVGITMIGNIFNNNSTLNCPVLDTIVTTLTASGNVYAITGLPIKINSNGAV